MDAAAGGASVALVRDGQVVDERTLARHGSAEALAPAVDELLHHAQLGVKDLTEIIVGAGPGSFTGLRVVAALAKGLCFAANVPLCRVSSLALIATASTRGVPRSCAVLDALRGEWYLQRVDVSAGRASLVGAVERLPRAVCESLAAAEGRALMGPPIDATQQPHARGAVMLHAAPVDLHAWEPDYGRLAEAQVVWETTHGRPLPAA
jgi:tRNA threonylcarbamoyladenosine biosynthesis protein TsaB